LIVNVAGSFVIGVLAGWFAFRGEQAGGQHLRLFLTTGILGGFTTFSAFSLDASALWQRHDLSGLALYVLGSILLSLIAVFAGLASARLVFAG
jgi:CrcB protein